MKHVDYRKAPLIGNPQKLLENGIKPFAPESRLATEMYTGQGSCRSCMSTFKEIDVEDPIVILCIHGNRPMFLETLMHMT